MGELLALAAGLFFGLSNITIRQGQLQQEMDQFTGIFVGVVLNNALNLLLLALFVLRGSPFPPMNLQAAGYFAAAGLLTSFMGREFLFKSIRLIGPSRAVALKITAPVFTVILGILVLHEKIAIPSFLGIGLILTATYFISLEQGAAQRKSGRPVDVKTFLDKKRYRKGVAAALLAGMALGAGNVFRKMGMLYYGSPVVGVSISSFAALLYMLILLARRGRLGDALESLPKMLKGGYLWTGALTSLALYSTFSALLFSPVSIVNSIKAAEPLFTITGSYLLLRSREVITKRLVYLTLLVIAGVILIAVFG
jgi:drug/metabolite transporter (DMT)-like permease